MHVVQIPGGQEWRYEAKTEDMLKCTEVKKSAQIWGRRNIKCYCKFNIHPIFTNMVLYQGAKVTPYFHWVGHFRSAMSQGQRKVKGQKFSIGENIWNRL